MYNLCKNPIFVFFKILKVFEFNSYFFIFSFKIFIDPSRSPYKMYILKSLSKISTPVKISKFLSIFYYGFKIKVVSYFMQSGPNFIAFKFTE
jgi:hypothetical protein